MIVLWRLFGLFVCKDIGWSTFQVDPVTPHRVISKWVHIHLPRLLFWNQAVGNNWVNLKCSSSYALASLQPITSPRPTECLGQANKDVTQTVLLNSHDINSFSIIPVWLCIINYVVSICVTYRSGFGGGVLGHLFWHHIWNLQGFLHPGVKISWYSVQPF